MSTIKKSVVEVTKKQSVEFGLVYLLVALYLENNNFVISAFIFMLVAIILPLFFTRLTED